MAASARFPTSFSSLPTVTSPGSPSSPFSPSASLSESLVFFDIADELWFCRSVIPLPAIALPCFPDFHVSSSPPDTSTLIAQCMYDGDFTSSPLAPSASTRACPDSEQTEYASWYFPAPPVDLKEDGYSHYIENGFSSMSDSDEDESYRGGYPRLRAGGEDEEAFHYDTAHSDWDDEDTYNGYNVPSDCEEEQPLQAEELEGEMSADDIQKPNEYVEPEDALSGIYDVAALLKVQHSKEMEETRENHLTVPPPRIPQGAVVSQVSGMPRFRLSSGKDQADVKESLKLWAHAVALTLPWKSAAQARLLL